MTVSTHVLDTVRGVPARDVAFVLMRDGSVLFEGATDENGRCPALGSVAVLSGRYSLKFAVAAYFRTCGADLPDPPFLDSVTIDFGVSDERAHYHVPLLVSPFSYSTYRGS